MSPSLATYVYALLRSQAAPATGGAPAGLPGLSAPRALDAGGGLWLVAADAPLPDYGADEIGRRLEDLSWVSTCALAHERMVEHFGAAATLVPMKLFTLFAGDARAVEHIGGERGRLARLLDRIEGCREWGVRVLFDEAAARAALDAEGNGGEGGGPSGGAGTAFLQQKKRQRQAARTLAARAGAAAEELFAALAARARDAVRRDPPAAEVAARLLLDAAFLVPEEAAAAFEEEVGRGAEALRRLGGDVTLTGPWPAYNFAAEEEG
ncbi:MAG TPA: GvpL/GvpF family gas vesicle protein [Thermoanaerobaculia bacterium]